MNDNASRRVMTEVLGTQGLKRQVERLASRITYETDGDKAAELLLSLLGLLKNGKSANEAVSATARCLLVAASASCTEHLVKENIPLMVVNVMKANPSSSIVQKVTAISAMLTASCCYGSA